MRKLLPPPKLPKNSKTNQLELKFRLLSVASADAMLSKRRKSGEIKNTHVRGCLLFIVSLLILDTADRPSVCRIVD